MLLFNATGNSEDRHLPYCFYRSDAEIAEGKGIRAYAYTEDSPLYGSVLCKEGDGIGCGVDSGRKW